MDLVETEESVALRQLWREFHDRYLREAEQWSDRSTDPNARIDFMMLRRDMQVADGEFEGCMDGLMEALAEQTARGDRAEGQWDALRRAVDTMELAASAVRAAFDELDDESL